MSVSRVALSTHSDPVEGSVVSAALEAAGRAGCELLADPDELDKQHGGGHDLSLWDGDAAGVDLCLALGGDGTILRALRRFAGTEVPVFGVNYGTIGFLAASDPDEVETAFEAAFSGAFSTVSLPGLETSVGERRAISLNDVSFTRRPHHRVAELSYSLGGQEVGRVRCDGLVAATPAGSTGYNLANGGPILAWGVAGFVVSFIAPHTLTARALVVAPDDVLHVTNVADRDSVELASDGVPIGELPPGEEIEVRFRDGVGRLAQLEGSNFYRRIRDKFGRLAH